MPRHFTGTDCLAEQINAARGRLKSVLHRELYDCVDELLGYARCELKKDVLWGYFTALNRTKSWPLERYAKRYSIQQLLDNLEEFDYEDPHPTHTCWDHSCGQDFTWVVNKAIQVTSSQFDGLCLGELPLPCYKVNNTNLVRLHGSRCSRQRCEEKAVQVQRPPSRLERRLPHHTWRDNLVPFDDGSRGQGKDLTLS